MKRIVPWHFAYLPDKHAPEPPYQVETHELWVCPFAFHQVSWPRNTFHLDWKKRNAALIIVYLFFNKRWVRSEVPHSSVVTVPGEIDSECWLQTRLGDRRRSQQKKLWALPWKIFERDNALTGIKDRLVADTTTNTRLQREINWSMLSQLPPRMPYPAYYSNWGCSCISFVSRFVVFRFSAQESFVSIVEETSPWVSGKLAWFFGVLEVSLRKRWACDLKMDIQAKGNQSDNQFSGVYKPCSAACQDWNWQ